MEKTTVQKLAGVLRVLVIVTFVCNLLVFPFIPGMVGIGSEGGWYTAWGVDPGQPIPGQPAPGVVVFLAVCWKFLPRVWLRQDMAVLTVFLIFCGVCTAIILWQAKRVLDTVMAQTPFQKKNAKTMKKAAISFFLIAGAAVCRLGWGLSFYQNASPVFTYNTLFIPIFAMGGLLCLVLSALIRQAAELKEENDLTI